MTTDVRSARAVTKIIRGQPTSDGDGVRLTRIIGGHNLPDLDPFLLFDEFGSDSAADYIGGFPNHPHRGFETVTYMLVGRMRHRDNQGNSGLLVPGSVQWMTAGRGIVHSEMPEQEQGRMRGFQLWVNLPARDKMTEPRYQDIPPEQIRAVRTAGGAQVRVVAGQFGDVTGAVQGVATAPLYLDVHLPAGAAFEADVPSGHNAFVYVYEGGICVDARAGAPTGNNMPAASSTVERGQLAVLGAGDYFSCRATDNAQFVVVAGQPLREPIARHGPFVMNTRQEIKQAFEDFNAGRF